MSPSGLFHMEDDTFIKHELPEEYPVASFMFSMAIDNSNNIWTGSSSSSYNGAILKYTIESDSWQYLKSSSSSAFDAYSVNFVRIDPFGNKWISKLGNGVYLYNEGGLINASYYKLHYAY